MNVNFVLEEGEFRASNVYQQPATSPISRYARKKIVKLKSHLHGKLDDNYGGSFLGMT